MILERIKGGLVVSCQALPDEPLHGALIMAKMARAAKVGGAAGIRANSKADVVAIAAEVDLPIIGIIKRAYAGRDVFITPTCREVDELVGSGCEMVALDATARPHPRESLADIVAHARHLGLSIMGDIADTRDVQVARALGLDCISTALYGYTPETAGRKLFADDFAFLKKVLRDSTVPVVAEGNVLTPEMYARCMALGVHACVVGGAITRPQLITQRFVAAWSSGGQATAPREPSVRSEA